MANLSYYLEMVFDEGEQAEAYRKRKAAEKEKAKSDRKADMRRMMKRDNLNNDGYSVLRNKNISKRENEFGNYDLDDPVNKPIEDAQSKYSAAYRKAGKGQPLPKTNSEKDVNEYRYRNQIRADAIYRHDRRHPQKEFTILNPDLI